eukprot:m.68837 g.68837  ORF g.68837 m.68837 type:complete len:343 (+) comp14207_c0_seq1:253-1281(+)
MAAVELIKRAVMVAVGLVWASVITITIIFQTLRGKRPSLTVKQRSEPAVLSQSSTRYGTHGYLDVDNGVKLHYVTKGSGPLMLLLHGFPEFWYSWRFQIDEFSKTHKVVAIDMRGYNLSSKPSGIASYRLEILAADVARVVERFGEKSCILVAHDWGGVVAWQVAHLYPEIVSKLVIMNAPHPAAFEKNVSFKQFLASWYIFLFQLPFFPEFISSMNDMQQMTAALTGKKMGVKNRNNLTKEDLECFKYAGSQPGATTAAINYYRNLWRNVPTPATKLVKCPTLLIWGEDDGALVKSLNNGIEAFVPKIRVHYVPNCSHWVNQDNPEEVNKAMREFLSTASS